MLKKSSSVDSNASNASTGENAAIDLHGEKMLVTLGQPRQLDTKYKRGMKNERERTEPPTPVPMPGIGDEVATMVSCGDTCAMILTSAGRVFVWGTGPVCDVVATSLAPSTPKTPRHMPKSPKSPASLQTPSPLKRAASGLGQAGGKHVSGLPPCSVIACGGEHALAVAKDGGLYSWGAMMAGQLGIGEASAFASHEPREVITLKGEHVSAISGGHAHSLALLSTGELYAWGDASHYQLGIPEAANETPPHIIVPWCVLSLAHMQVVQAEAGATMSACVTQGGAVYTWGSATHGELGHGDAVTALPKPVAIARLWGLKVTKVACGAHHCVARLRNGQLMSWGDNTHGQLGVGHKNGVESLSVPTPVDLPGAHAARDVVAGTAHTVALCGGVAYGAGRNAEAQLGIAEKAGTTKMSFVEARALKGLKFHAAAAGSAMTLLVASDGALAGEGEAAPTAKERWFAASKGMLRNPEGMTTLHALSQLLAAPTRMAAKNRLTAEQKKLLQLGARGARHRALLEGKEDPNKYKAAENDDEWEGMMANAMEELETEAGKDAHAYEKLFSGRAKREAEKAAAPPPEKTPKPKPKKVEAPAPASEPAPKSEPMIMPGMETWKPPPKKGGIGGGGWQPPVDASAPRRYPKLPRAPVRKTILIDANTFITWDPAAEGGTPPQKRYEPPTLKKRLAEVRAAERSAPTPSTPAEAEGSSSRRPSLESKPSVDRKMSDRSAKKATGILALFGGNKDGGGGANDDIPLDAMLYRAAFTHPPPLHLGGAPVAGALHAAPNDYSRGSSTLLKSPVEALKRPAHDLRGIAEDSESLKSGLKEHMTGRDVANAALSKYPAGGELLPPPPPKLEFFATWVQDKKPRKMALTYDTATKECEVRLDGAPAAFVVSLRDGKGNPLEPIDLWVGRPVDVLGRRTTLQHASSTTMDWLTTAAWRFDEAQQVLETALIRLSVKVPKMVHSRDAVQSRTGTTSLRLLSRRTVEMQQMWREARVAGEQDVISLRRSSRAARMPMMPHKPVRQASRKPYLEKKLSDRSEANRRARDKMISQFGGNAARQRGLRAEAMGRRSIIGKNEIMRGDSVKLVSELSGGDPEKAKLLMAAEEAAGAATEEVDSLRNQFLKAQTTLENLLQPAEDLLKLAEAVPPPSPPPPPKETIVGYDNGKVVGLEKKNSSFYTPKPPPKPPSLKDRLKSSSDLYGGLDKKPSARRGSSWGVVRQLAEDAQTDADRSKSDRRHKSIMEYYRQEKGQSKEGVTSLERKKSSVADIALEAIAAKKAPAERAAARVAAMARATEALEAEEAAAAQSTAAARAAARAALSFAAEQAAESAAVALADEEAAAAQSTSAARAAAQAALSAAAEQAAGSAAAALADEEAAAAVAADAGAAAVRAADDAAKAAAAEAAAQAAETVAAALRAEEAAAAVAAEAAAAAARAADDAAKAAATATAAADARLEQARTQEENARRLSTEIPPSPGRPLADPGPSADPGEIPEEIESKLPTDVRPELVVKKDDYKPKRQSLAERLAAKHKIELSS